MGKINRDDLGFLGSDFQIRLIAQLVTDRKFANNIIDIISPNHFGDEHLRVIVNTIKIAFEDYEVIPDMGSLKIRLLEQVKDEIDRKFLLTQLRHVEEANLSDTEWVQDTAMKFCKQQELIRAMIEIDGIIKKGDLNNFPECEEILKKAMTVGDNKDGSIDVFHDLPTVLSDDFRQPIPTDIKGLDEIMEGGLAKGELGVILAPFGVGKTTIMTKLANSAYNHGNNVLQIFFEDMPMVVQRKHISCLSGIELNNLKFHKKEIHKKVEEWTSGNGELRLQKMNSHGTTVNNIKQLIRKMIATGFKPDMVIIDYIDCVQPSKHFDDINVAEGNVMREFETLLAEFDMAGWTAVQGNRSSINAEEVDSTMIGGSIKRGQIGHFILSIAKTQGQKVDNTATLGILKSRFGKDGFVIRDTIFNNGTVYIEAVEHGAPSGNPTTYHEHTQNKQEASKAVVRDLMIKKLGDADLKRQEALDAEDSDKVENVSVK